MDFKTLLGINNEKMADINRRHQCQMAREDLSYLIFILMFEKNPYEAKQEIKKYEIIQKWVDYYGINIDCVTKGDVKILFEILKKI